MLVECAQGAMLDIDYGTYPYVTSSSPTAAGACQGAGIAPTAVARVIAVFKAYSTRVGGGPFPTELLDETGQLIRERGREYGTTTGRPRRVGWFDTVAARHVIRLNGVTEIALTLVDVLDVLEEIRICDRYELHGAPIDYIPSSISTLSGVNAPLLRLTLAGNLTSPGRASARIYRLYAISYADRLANALAPRSRWWGSVRTAINSSP